MKIWIDFANSPHPLLFAPIVRVLEDAGHEVALTARDNAQTVQLARERWPEVEVIGSASPHSRAAKSATLGTRARELRRWARANRPHVALSHNSYAQIVAAKLAGVPAVTAMDYEHQPANHLAFRLADLVLLPEPLRGAALSRQGATARKTRFYPGLKEEIYLGDFEPDPRILDRIGVRFPPEGTVVVARSAPSCALYHRAENDFFFEILRRLGRDPSTTIIALLRYEEQRRAVAALQLPNCLVPPEAVDSRSLMYAADAVFGAGGTMTREAALLGVPTFSIFKGRRARVDQWLERRGALKMLEEGDDLPEIARRRADPKTITELRRRSDRLVDAFVAAVDEAGPGAGDAPANRICRRRDPRLSFRPVQERAPANHNRYDRQFVPVSGGTFQDFGTRSFH